MDPAVKKKALRMITYGLFVATAQDDSGPAAGAINWISQSSFTPPLIMVAFKADSALHRAVTASRKFIVHVVAKDQKDLASAFFRGAELSGDKLNGYRIEKSPTEFRCWWIRRLGSNAASRTRCAAATIPYSWLKWSKPEFARTRIR